MRKNKKIIRLPHQKKQRYRQFDAANKRFHAIFPFLFQASLYLNMNITYFLKDRIFVTDRLLFYYEPEHLAALSIC